MSKDLEVEDLKWQAQKEWEERGHEAGPDLALLTRADINGGKSEQWVGKETLLATQASLVEATGDTTLSEESRQLLLLSVCPFLIFKSLLPSAI